MAAYSDDGDDDYAYDSDAALDSDDDASALLEDEDDSPLPDKAKQPAGKVAYESLSPERLQQRVDRDVDRVAALTGCEPAIVTILLCQHRWNADRLIDKYMDAPEQTLRAAGEPAPSARPPHSPAKPPAKRARISLAAPEPFVCEICFDAPAPDSASTLRCGHRFCNACWASYADGKIRDEGVCMVPCMADKCACVLDAPTLRRVVEPAVYERWKTLLLQSYVAAHPALRFCPHPGCAETLACAGAAGSALLSAVPTVACGAGHALCAGCGMDASHAPLVCSLAARWLQSAREDAGTSQWIKANTRECPKCHGIIEKGGGCNRMMCRHCNFQFCWLCMKDWDVHGYNDKVCSTWKEPDLTDDMTEAKRHLERWLFYFDRFNNHELSTALDVELLGRSAERITRVQEETGLSWIEAQYMREAVEELSRCRQTLKWTYAMAHFLENGNDKEIFEANQIDLEAAVEQLSQLLQEEITADTVKELQQKTINRMVYVRQRHDIILDDTARRLAEGTWKWTISIE